jgi:hypothetical protein
MGEMSLCSASYCSSRDSSIVRPGTVGDASSGIRVGVGTIFGVATLNFGLWEELVLEMNGESFVNTAEARNKMILERAYGALSSIAPVGVRDQTQAWRL